MQKLQFERIEGIERSGEAPFVYVNSAQLKISPYDLQIIFGQATGPSEDRTAILVQNLITVVMSPQHAKAFSQVLALHVQLFEETVGPIQIPADAVSNPKATEPGRPSSRSRGARRKRASRP